MNRLWAFIGFLGVMSSSGWFERNARAAAFGADTVGGRGGRIIRVTNLDADGRGSLRQALWAKGPRIVVFEVAGVIDLAGRDLNVSEPFVTIAGQTAPSPGITLIRGGLKILTHDVIVQHLKVRPGENDRPKKSGWEVDGISTVGAWNVLVDHCSCTWATDENLSASGERFKGATPEEWRRNTSHNITFQNCLIAEALSKSTHGKGEHSKGTLLHDNTGGILVRNNLYACNKDRNPYAKGGVEAVLVNNWISNPRSKAVSHGLSESEWRGHAPQRSRLVIAGNVFEHGPDTVKDSPLLKNYGGHVDVWLQDNVVTRLDGRPGVEVDGDLVNRLAQRPFWPVGLELLPAKRLKAALAADVGARPWDRDPIDARIIQAALDRKGRIISGEGEVGGYPQSRESRAAFKESEWNLANMERR